MTLPSTGVLRLSSIQTEFGGTSPIRLSEYYRDGAFVPAANTDIPESGVIAVDDFYGTSQVVPVTYEIIGGGGEGGGGSYGGTGHAGTDSSLSASGMVTVTASGGAGGVSQGLFKSQSGEASHYGRGGYGGRNSDSGNQSVGYSAPSTSYGAGGGGGGSAPFSAYNGGYGGKAGTRETGTVNLSPGTVVTVTIGEKGAGISGGGNGANGYASIQVGTDVTTFTLTGTHTYTVPSL